MNHCGSCTMCCKLRGVQELDKPGYKWCDHCDKGVGCSIYAKRPKSCAEYVCLWLQMKQEGYEFPDRWKPNNCGTVVDTAVTKFGEAFLVWRDNNPAASVQSKLHAVELIDFLVKLKKNTVILCYEKKRSVIYTAPGVGDKVLQEMGLK